MSVVVSDLWPSVCRRCTGRRDMGPDRPRCGRIRTCSFFARLRLQKETREWSQSSFLDVKSLSWTNNLKSEGRSRFETNCRPEPESNERTTCWNRMFYFTQTWTELTGESLTIIQEAITGKLFHAWKNKMQLTCCLTLLWCSNETGGPPMKKIKSPI